MSETVKIPIEEGFDGRELFGNMDTNADTLRDALGVSMILRGNEIIISGEKSVEAARIVEEMMEVIRKGGKLDKQKANYIMTLGREGVSYAESDIDSDIVCFTHLGKPLKPKTIGQKKYVDSIRKKDIVFGIGPAGTGKTYLAVAMAINAYKKKEVERIILARPAVEAGESLGFLPGDLQEKVDPYLRPLYDALFDMLGRETADRLREKEIVEVVPLAYMRGRTLDKSFIILDEAQNTTKEQMKMFLTRMGFGSKMVVTGDVTQIDLPRGKTSGLKHAEKVLKYVKEIDFCHLGDADVVRHELVRKIIKAYDKYKGE